MSKKSAKMPPKYERKKSLITSNFEGSEYNTLIFPEWTDEDLNAESWEPEKPPIKSASQVTIKSPPLPFRDKHSFTLPATFQVYKWKKPHILFPGKTFVIYKESNIRKYAEMIEANRHLFRSAFMRSFVSSVASLEHMGYTSPWPMEGTSSNFVPNTLHEPWKPWHHIYSLCKAGKGQKHKPIINKMGKYVLRLFWMGTWRRVIVDDFLPVDRNDVILLPSAQKVKHPNANNNEEGEQTQGEEDDNIVEMWPFILCKGLLKIANLTWSENRQLVDFNVIHCYTGWVCQKLTTLNLNPNELWDIVMGYTKHFTWEDNNNTSKVNVSPSLKSVDKGKKEKNHEKGKEHEKEKGKEHDKGKGKDSNKLGKPQANAYCVIMHVTEMKLPQDATAEKLPALAPCTSHVCLVTMIRNIPFEKPEFKPVMKRWKRFRWMHWAQEKGIFAEEQSNIKVLRLVDVFRHVGEDGTIARRHKSYTKSTLRMSTGSRYMKEAKLSGETTNTKESKTSTKNEDSDIPPDPSFWADFMPISPYVDYIYIFFRPAMFNTYYVVTDIQDNPHKPKEELNKEMSKRRLIWPYDLKKTRNEPVYIFFDSLDYQTVIICMNHAGNRAILEQKCLLVHCDLTSLWQKKFSYVERAKMRTHSNIMIEKYDWEADTYGELAIGLYTKGMQSLVVSVEPGRTILRFWIYSATSFCVDLLSDYAFEIGNLEYILECMQSESERFQQMCFDFGVSFGNLVKAFGTPFYIEKMREFYKSYKPDCNMTKVEGDKIDDEMFKELSILIKRTYTDCGDIMFALRVLFLKPNYGIDCRAKNVENERTTSTVLKYKQEKEKPESVNEEPQWDDMECFSDQFDVSSDVEDEIMIEKIRERAACTIQTFCKMIYTQFLRSCQNRDNPNFARISNNLRKLYQDVFNVDNCVTIFPNFFRKLLYRSENLTGILEKYSLHNDMHLVLNCQCLLEEIPCRFNSWVLIGRYNFYVNSPFVESIKICLFSTLDHYVLRVFNNDTDEEIINCINDAMVDQYSSNAKGYTILAYGWNELDEFAKFKINLVTLKKSDTPPLIIPPYKQSLVQLSDIYHYNVNNIIAKCTLTIDQETALSLRMTSSYPKIIIKLRCLDSSGKLIREITGKQQIVMPLLQLKCEEDQNSEIENSEKSSNSRSMSRSNSSRRFSNSELASVKTSTTTGSKVPSKRSSETPRGSNTCQKSTYFIEAYVMKDSWPLTCDEWRESIKIAERNLIGSTVSSKLLMKRLSDMNKNLSKIDYDSLPNPKWCLQVIHNDENPVTLQFDTSRSKEIGKIKMGWYQDKSRYHTAKMLRQEYLNSFRGAQSVSSSSSILIDNFTYSLQECSLEGSITIDDFQRDSFASLKGFKSRVTKNGKTDYSSGEVRTTTKPKSSLVELLPEFDCKIYAYPSTIDDESEQKMYNPFEYLSSGSSGSSWKTEASGVLKKPEDFVTDIEKQEKAVEEFAIYHEQCIQNMLDFRVNTLETSNILENWYSGIREDSSNLIGQAYRMRATFIDILEEYERELHMIKEEQKKLEAAKESPRPSDTKSKGKTKDKDKGKTKEKSKKAKSN